MERFGGRRHLAHARHLAIIDEAPMAEARNFNPLPNEELHFGTTNNAGFIKPIIALFPRNCLRSFRYVYILHRQIVSEFGSMEASLPILDMFS
jgi:hypothetical protein